MDGPAVLMLGERYLAPTTGPDPLLEAAAARYHFDPARGWSAFIRAEEVVAAGAAALSWLAERARRLEPPTWLESVGEFAWNGAVVSGIDGIWLRTFRNGWRDVQPIYEDTYRPRDARSSDRLNVLALFGNAMHAGDPSKSAPLRRELQQRRVTAVKLASRLPELLTPKGTLVIEAYDEHDLFRLDDLAGVIGSLGHGQVHVFSATPALREGDLGDLADEGIVVFHGTDLSSTMAASVDAGRIELGPRVAPGSSRHVRIGERTFAVPKEIWRDVSRVGHIVDEAAIEAPTSVTTRELRFEFADFLANADGTPRWEGHTRGFVFRREYADHLEELVRARLAARDWQRPVVLHGQTGTGKTMALQAIALHLATEDAYAVLYIDRRPDPPRLDTIDRFAQWAEEIGARGTLLVWDGMRDPGDYSQFASALSARGRRILLVGSSYRLHEEEIVGRRFVEVPDRLLPNEQEAFVEFISRFDPELASAVASHRDALDDTFLVALYRLLPSSQFPVRAGVAREAVFTEVQMETAATRLERPRARNALAAALQSAGLLDAGFDQAAAELGGESLDFYKRLTGLVMVPGQFGLRVPLELLLRALGTQVYADFLSVLNRVDMIRWYDDGFGNYELGARSPLEAQLVVQQRHGGPRVEAEVARELVSGLRGSGEFYGGDHELEFTIRFIQALTRESRYFPHLELIAEALRELREEGGLESARLMLQEANLLRDRAMRAGRAAAPVSADDLVPLERAAEVIDDALELHDLPAMLVSQLHTELASVKGVLARQLLEIPQPQQDRARALFSELQDELRAAQAANPGNLHPLDVLAWVTIDLSRLGLLEGTERIEAVINALHRIQDAQAGSYASIDPRLLRSQLRIADLLGNEELADETLAELRAQGSAAGIYARAVQQASLPIRGPRLSDAEMEDVSVAFAVLDADVDLVVRDVRALTLYFNLWWMGRSGYVPMQGERIAVPFERHDWERALALLDQLDALEPPPMWRLFLRAVAQFHLDLLVHAEETFRQLDGVSAMHPSARRVIRTYVASNPDGTPKVFHGEIARVHTNQKRADVQVQELGRRVLVMQRDFDVSSLRPGDALGGFGIAFNFIGPVADPVAAERRTRT